AEEAGPAGGRGEGLAMACFPRRRRRRVPGDGRGQRLFPPQGGRGGRREAGGDGTGGAGSDAENRVEDNENVSTAAGAVWSVTLFRRPSEFSEAAVSALVGGDAGISSAEPGPERGSGVRASRSASASKTPPRSRSRSGAGASDAEEIGSGGGKGEGKEASAAISGAAVVATLPVYTYATLCSDVSGICGPAREILS
ncbi:unnamed protein product, partial [Scytosiphon promiscuus]